VAAEDLSDGLGDGPIACEIGGDEGGFGAEALGGDGGHGGSDAVFSGFVRGGADDGAGSSPGDDDRFAPQTGIVPLLHGGVERIHIDVHYLSSHSLIGVSLPFGGGLVHKPRVSPWAMIRNPVRGSF